MEIRAVTHDSVDIAQEQSPSRYNIDVPGPKSIQTLADGLKDSASVCQHLVSQTLADYPGAIAHIDDILIFGSTRAEHDANLRMALQRLSDKDFRLRLAKCEFVFPKVTSLDK
ncbi:RNA-directed DNA polymerase homolog [Plakobranchus ocellatus]|uniref:RNA-directed DNA polymerase homolog n=1 Tax=Plakobranchus ocellatus TaxID=259542 RepID=A0AAV4A1G5_9GAST|nr:RNA-directed DNA polymerase homolog [Plakobranchus ocellatus]